MGAEEISSADAGEWAERFVVELRASAEEDSYGLTLVWFTNAIAAGRRAERARLRELLDADPAVPEETVEKWRARADARSS